jgi:AraC-like DNA-binding protein
MTGSSDPHFLYLERRASPAASGIVRDGWVIQAAQCRTRVERILPDTAISVYLNLGPRGRRQHEGKTDELAPRDAWVVGPHAASILVDKEVADCDLVALRLHPGTAERVLGASARELRDSMVDLDSLIGRRMEPLRDQLHAAPPDRRLAIAEAALVKYAPSASHDISTRGILSIVARAGPDLSIGALAKSLGVSHRRVIEVVETATGLKPKAFQIVRRLRRALLMSHVKRAPRWSAIAQAAGYYDQAHMINDVRRYAGITPTKYLADRSSVGFGFVAEVRSDSPPGF